MKQLLVFGLIINSLACRLLPTMSNTSRSPRSTSAESLTLAPIDPERYFGGAYFDPFDFDDGQLFNPLPGSPSPEPYNPESNTHERQPPPSNQEASQQFSRSHSRYQISSSPDPFDDFGETDSVWPESPSPPRIAQSRTRASSIVDLTEASPPPDDMAPNRRKRRADSPKVTAGPAKRGRLSKTPVKSSRSTPSRKPKSEDDVVDLVDINDEEDYKDFRAKQQADAIKQQQKEESSRPVKLADVECIICMDRMTDLTVTHCGKLYLLDSCRYGRLTPLKVICSAPNAFTKPSTLAQGRRLVLFAERP